MKDFQWNQQDNIVRKFSFINSKNKDIRIFKVYKDFPSHICAFFVLKLRIRGVGIFRKSGGPKPGKLPGITGKITGELTGNNRTSD